MRMDIMLARAPTYVLFWTLLVPAMPVGHAQQAVLAERQQAALAQDILSHEEDGRRQRAVSVAERLGPERISDDVRVALIELMEQLSDQQDIALAEGMPTNDVVNFEFFMHVARVVASLDDPRSIPALARVGNYGFSRPAAHGIASFGEQALPAILNVIDAPDVSHYATEYSIIALTKMVEDGGVQNLSMSARRDIARVARNSLQSQWTSILHPAMDLSVALNEPDLVQAVQAIAHDPSALRGRGFDQSTAIRTRQHALDAISKASE